MLAILNSLNAHNFPIFQPILMILYVSMVHRALSDQTYLLLRLLSPLKRIFSLVTISRTRHTRHLQAGKRLNKSAFL